MYSSDHLFMEIKLLFSYKCFFNTRAINGPEV